MLVRQMRGLKTYGFGCSEFDGVLKRTATRWGARGGTHRSYAQIVAQRLAQLQHQRGLPGTSRQRNIAAEGRNLLHRTKLQTQKVDIAPLEDDASGRQRTTRRGTSLIMSQA